MSFTIAFSRTQLCMHVTNFHKYCRNKTHLHEIDKIVTNNVLCLTAVNSTYKIEKMWIYHQYQYTG